MTGEIRSTRTSCFSATLFTINGLKSNPSFSGERPGAPTAATSGSAILDYPILRFVIRIYLFIAYPPSAHLLYLFSIRYSQTICAFVAKNVYNAQF